jgi:hypothetical protein
MDFIHLLFVFRGTGKAEPVTALAVRARLLAKAQSSVARFVQPPFLPTSPKGSAQIQTTVFPHSTPILGFKMAEKRFFAPLSKSLLTSLFSYVILTLQFCFWRYFDEEACCRFDVFDCDFIILILSKFPYPD